MSSMSRAVARAPSRLTCPCPPRALTRTWREPHCASSTLPTLPTVSSTSASRSPIATRGWPSSCTQTTSGTTVYVEREYDQLLITDRRDTYVYLGGADDDDIVSLLPEEEARAICAGHGVDLDSSDAEAWPWIQREVGETEDVRQVVAAVAAAIDEVFCAANKYLD